ncbi:MAG: hypothetical protein WBA02_10420 [Jannaschia helgolandensis]|jgi:hypothetical protein|uniref:Uncharacterized protein n=1 Tax=Jannaschia helgolandensis TaxID=188906 RepID=A0A1H7J5S3_9RHOB|nr:hypothetical protein [Jannaschia helgolandensis]SEK70028.1 hypothetical protein SAMN04488526_1272 [Jannaschia helgolandensis]
METVRFAPDMITRNDEVPRMSLETAKKSGLSLVRKHSHATIAVFTMAAILITAGANAVTLIAPQSRKAPAPTTNIAVTAFSQNAMVETINKACEVVGCDIDNLHPLILAYADTMDRDQLDSGRWAQMRTIVENLAVIDKSPDGSESKVSAQLELTAAARIARLYTAKLHYLR